MVILRNVERLPSKGRSPHYLFHAFSGVERWGLRGRASPGDIISRGDAKRKKLINFVDKMVKKNFGVKWL